MYYNVESALALCVTLFINVCVVSVFARGFFGRETQEGEHALVGGWVCVVWHWRVCSSAAAGHVEPDTEPPGVKAAGTEPRCSPTL